MRYNAIAAFDNPFFLVLAGSQPEPLIEALTKSEITNGLLSRFFLFDVGEEWGKPKDGDELLSLPDKIILWSKQFEGVGDNVAIQVGTGVDFKAHAQRCMEQRRSGKRFTELWNRTHQHARIIAGLLAVGQSPRKPSVTPPIWEYAVWLAERSTQGWITLMGGSTRLTGNDGERSIALVREIVRNPRKHISRANSKAQNELLQRGLVPKSIITRAFPYDLRQFYLNEAINRLVEGEEIARGHDGGNEVFWFPQGGR